MSRFESPVAEIERMRICKWPAKPIAGMRVVRVDTHVIGVSPKGEIYSSQIRGNFWYTLGSRFDSTFAGLQKLKVLTPGQVAIHTRKVDEVNARRDKKYATQGLADAAKTLGIKLTKSQQAVVLAAAAAGAKA